MNESSPPTERTRLRRRPQRGDYTAETVRQILDAGSICHVAVAHAEQAFVIPIFYARMEDELIVHGSTANRVLRALANGAEACVTVTLVDAIVLARSAFHHSMNYRSVIAYGRARKLEQLEHKTEALRLLIEKLVPGRWDDTRRPSTEELARTLVLALPLSEASAKVRQGPPVDEAEDYALAHWAGELPLRTEYAAPVRDPRLAPELALPAYVERWMRGDRSVGAWEARTGAALES